MSTLYPPNTSQPDRFNYCQNTNPRAPCVNTGTEAVISARSYHPGGVVVLWADASVRFVSATVNPAAWTAAGTRMNSEAIQVE